MPPTAAELSRFSAGARQPAYWLGPRFRGITVSHAALVGREVRLTYGPWECDTGCTDADGQDEIPVRSVVRRLRPLNARAPWPLARPERWTCRELERIDGRYRRHMPRALRPRAAC